MNTKNIESQMNREWVIGADQRTAMVVDAENRISVTDGIQLGVLKLMTSTQLDATRGYRPIDGQTYLLIEGNVPDKAKLCIPFDIQIAEKLVDELQRLSPERH